MKLGIGVKRAVDRLLMLKTPHVCAGLAAGQKMGTADKKNETDGAQARNSDVTEPASKRSAASHGYNYDGHAGGACFSRFAANMDLCGTLAGHSPPPSPTAEGPAGCPYGGPQRWHSHRYVDQDVFTRERPCHPCPPCPPWFWWGGIPRNWLAQNENNDSSGEATAKNDTTTTTISSEFGGQWGWNPAGFSSSEQGGDVREAPWQAYMTQWEKHGGDYPPPWWRAWQEHHTQDKSNGESTETVTDKGSQQAAKFPWSGNESSKDWKGWPGSWQQFEEGSAGSKTADKNDAENRRGPWGRGEHGGPGGFPGRGPPFPFFFGGRPPWSEPAEPEKDPPLEGEPFSVESFQAMKRWADGEDTGSPWGFFPWFGPPGMFGPGGKGPWGQHTDGEKGPGFGPPGMFGPGGRGPWGQHTDDEKRPGFGPPGMFGPGGRGPWGQHTDGEKGPGFGPPGLFGPGGRGPWGQHTDDEKGPGFRPPGMFGPGGRGPWSEYMDGEKGPRFGPPGMFGPGGRGPWRDYTDGEKRPGFGPPGMFGPGARGSWNQQSENEPCPGNLGPWGPWGRNQQVSASNEDEFTEESVTGCPAGTLPNEQADPDSASSSPPPYHNPGWIWGNDCGCPGGYYGGPYGPWCGFHAGDSSAISHCNPASTFYPDRAFSSCWSRCPSADKKQSSSKDSSSVKECTNKKEDSLSCDDKK